uniref:Replication protein A 70 kDa DNA-binding subunit B/D first OB fold domain-containing protein n=1 Tax=Noccaea caerulescens TaxID=107243 RepID=A0A1J3F3N2_NOCCA
MASPAIPLSVDPPSFQVLDKIEGQFCIEEVFVRLLHFWEARNFKKGNVLMGVELLLLDAKSKAVQGFISANRLSRHEESLKRNSVFKLKKFMIRPAKALYRVSDHKNTICFTDLTTMTPIVDCAEKIATQKFRLRGFNDFATIADRDYDLFDAIGQLRLITGDNLKSPTTAEPPMEVAENRSKERVFLHLMQDGENIRVNLWGDIAGAFRAT